MKPWDILHGDVRHVCKSMPDNEFDAVLCDPPYGLKFMGHRWDYSVPNAFLWSNVLRVIKPGAHAMIFGGSRTYHRLAVAVEDGGFVPRDMLLWLYSQGFSKGKIEDGYGTTLKPAFEPIMLARKNIVGTVKENLDAFGAGVLAIDQARIGHRTDGSLGRLPTNVILSHDDECVFVGESSNIEKVEVTKGIGGHKSQNTSMRGRNTYREVVAIKTRPPSEVWECVPHCPIALIDESSGECKGSTGVKEKSKSKSWFINSDSNVRAFAGYHDDGGISRIFYAAKADRHQRHAGTNEENDHPTIKPIDLIRYLAALILPPPRSSPRRILVPYSGSGSEIIGCLQAGWDQVVGIEREAKYIEIARARITKGGVFSSLDRRMKVRKKKSPV